MRKLCSIALIASLVVLPALVAVLPVADPANAASFGFLRKWGTRGTSDGQVNGPADIATDAQGNVYLADTGNSRIQKFSSTGTWLQTWGGAGAGPGKLSQPMGVTVDSQGNVYVADTQNNRVQKFTPDGEFVIAWGTKGSGTGQMSSPKGIAVDTADVVYVADSGNGRVQRFTTNGDFLGLWLVQDAPDRPKVGAVALALDNWGNVYIPDASTTGSRVLKFKSTGEFLMKWGAPGTLTEQFSSPAGIAVDRSGNVYVADTMNHRIQRFSSEGVFQVAWGSFGSTDGRLYATTGVAVDHAGNVYVADTKNHRVQVFGAAPDPGPYLTGPGDAASLPNLGATLSWQNPPGTLLYHLQVIPYNNDGPGADVVRGAESGGVFTLPSAPQWYGMLPDMGYTWRVRTTTSPYPSESDWSTWSSRTFRTPGASSDTIRLADPAPGNAVNSLTPAMTWTNTNAAVFYYEVQVSTDPTFTTDPETATAMVYSQLIHGGASNPPNTFTVPSQYPLQSNSTYYWRVRPRIQGNGTPVAWTGAGYFRTP